MATKTATIFLLDCSSSALPFHNAISRYIANLTHEQLLAGRKGDQQLIVHFGGATQTQNELDYKDITVHEWRLPTLTMPDTEPTDTDQADYIDALIVGIQEMKQHTKQLKFTRKIIVFATAHEIEEDDAERVSAEASKNQIEIEFVALGTTPISNPIVPTKPLEMQMQCHRTPRPVALFKGPFYITPNINIPVHVYAKTLEARFKTPEKVDVGDKPVNRTKETSSASENLLRTYRFGSDLIPVTQDDVDYVMESQAPGIWIREYIKDIPHQYLMSNTTVVIPTHFETLFGGLYDLMRRKRVVALARYVQRQDSAPKLVLLHPLPDGEGYKGFLMHTLPFQDDIRTITAPTLHSKADAKRTAVELVKSLEYTKALGEVSNPVIKRMHESIQARALDADFEILETGELEVPNHEALAAFALQFPVVPVEKIQKKRLHVSSVDASRKPVAELLKSVGVSSEKHAGKDVASDPIYNFHMMIKDNKIDQALEFMKALIEEKADDEDTWSDAYTYMLELFRVCPVLDEEEYFNVFLDELSHSRPQYWNTYIYKYAEITYLGDSDKSIDKQ